MYSALLLRLPGRSNLLKPALMLAVLCASRSGLAFQEAAKPAPDASANPAVAGVTASDLLQRSLEELQTTLTGLHLDKWKGGSVRTEAAANITSIQKDLQGTLPSLIATADAAPNAISKALPVSRNLDALYDVLVRVVDGARVAAPGDQADQLMQAMAGVQKGRLALNDHLQEMAASTEKQVGALQAAIVKAQTAVPVVCPAPAPKPTPTPAVKKKVVKKKPVTPPPTAQPAPAAAPKPNSQ